MADLFLRERHVPKEQRKNVEKHCQQIAFSLDQAREYFRSAEISGPTTRALMAYYGLIALANAEVLWLGDGEVSFDKRDDRFKAHGLELVQGSEISDFSVRPVNDHRGISGLFGLWRQLSTHLPHYGKHTTFYPPKNSEWSAAITSKVSNLSSLPMPDRPITLMECLKHIPAMRPALDAYGDQSSLCRGVITQSRTSWPDGGISNVQRQFLLYGQTDEVYQDILERFRLAPNVVPEFEFEQIGSGIAVTWKAHPDFVDVANFSMPEIFAHSLDRLFFVGSGEYLNEFGYYYSALYVAGMVTRYFPHIWIKELRRNSKGAVLINELVDHALLRVPVLAASALERRVFIYD
ncbi:hypothetical protein NMA58_13710 [Rhizobium sp. YTUHZ045]|uniref:YaaC family protein n=1 Tax=Rhizobium sp. YTUHZ045 TaxID=2962888 RepID=UPI003DA93DEE